MKYPTISMTSHWGTCGTFTYESFSSSYVQQYFDLFNILLDYKYHMNWEHYLDGKYHRKWAHYMDYKYHRKWAYYCQEELSRA